MNHLNNQRGTTDIATGIMMLLLVVGTLYIELFSNIQFNKLWIEIPYFLVIFGLRLVLIFREDIIGFIREHTGVYKQ